MKQQKLFREKLKSEFGGSLITGKRREARPLNLKPPVHLVLKATNSFVLLKHTKEIERLVRKYSERMGVKTYDCGIHADHIHLSVFFVSRAIYVRWIRALTSVLVILRVEKLVEEFALSCLRRFGGERSCPAK